MRPVEIEAWALRVLARLESGARSEDSRVGLKGEWVADTNKIARQIAGHCNAARGDDVLWLFGADKSTGVIGIFADDFADWWPSIVREFDGEAPTPTEVAFTHAGKQLVAVHLTADRAPFLVRNPEFGQVKGDRIAREVPWREGTSTRTATRTDLLTLLVPLRGLPEFEITQARLSLFPERETPDDLFMSMHVVAYVSAPTGS